MALPININRRDQRNRLRRPVRGDWTPAGHHAVCRVGGGYLIADEITRTSLLGVFAVGDVRTKSMRQIVTAAADGAVASHYIEEIFR